MDVKRQHSLLGLASHRIVSTLTLGDFKFIFNFNCDISYTSTPTSISKLPVSFSSTLCTSFSLLLF
jgi:hypothetical protein